MRQAAHRYTVKTHETFWQTLLTFSITRIVITVVLLVYLVLNFRKSADAIYFLRYWQICIAYLFLSICFAVLVVRYRRHFTMQLLAQIAADIAVISVLYVTAGGTKSGLAILYLFPLAGGAILAPMMLALFFASVTTLFLLAESVYQAITLPVEQTFLRAGLYGAAFLSTAFVVNRLAAKLVRQEELATRRGIDLQLQESINRLVIADMGDGILVIGSDGEILTGNPAAERMLGLSVPYAEPHYRVTEIPHLAPIANAFFAWSARPAGSASETADATAFVVVKPGDEISSAWKNTVWRTRHELNAHLKLRFATVQTPGLAEERSVIFLQDVTEIESQAQQLKLASMGRLTASIAHEVRNPLSAISYACSLLHEETSDPAQTRLLKIISGNVARLNQMIEDILKLSRKAQTHGDPLALGPFLAEILGEFRETHSLSPVMIHLGEMGRYHVWFDPLHLREVVVNLLSNAIRYASGRDGSIRIYALSDAVNRLELHVQDDGKPLTPEIRAHLFEPFYTTSSKGTGLGLYLARELCLNNGAMIDYEYRLNLSEDRMGETSGRFVITLAMANPG